MILKTKLIKPLILLLILACLPGCVTRNNCAGFKPIRPVQSDIETLDPQTKRQILAHNTFGQRQCGWAP